MRIAVDYDKCSGLGMCESIAPDVFEVEDDGSLTLHLTEVPGGPRGRDPPGLRGVPDRGPLAPGLTTTTRTRCRAREATDDHDRGRRDERQARLRPGRPVVPRLLGQVDRRARGVVRAAAGRAPGLLAPRRPRGSWRTPTRPGFWALVRHEDIGYVSKTPKLFCSGQGVQFMDAPQELLEASQSFLAMDSPRHAKLRKLVGSAFTPKQVSKLEDRISERADMIVEGSARPR